MFRLLITFTLLSLTASDLPATCWIPFTWPFCVVQFLLDAPDMTGPMTVPTVRTSMLVKFITASRAETVETTTPSSAPDTTTTTTLPPIHKTLNLTNTAQHPYIRYIQRYIDPTNKSFPVPGYFKSRQYFSDVTAGTSWFWTQYALCTSPYKKGDPKCGGYFQVKNPHGLFSPTFRTTGQEYTHYSETDIYETNPLRCHLLNYTTYNWAVST